MKSKYKKGKLTLIAEDDDEKRVLDWVKDTIEPGTFWAVADLLAQLIDKGVLYKTETGYKFDEDWELVQEKIFEDLPGYA